MTSSPLMFEILACRNDRNGSNCDLRHHLALRPVCGDKPTFRPERRLSLALAGTARIQQPQSPASGFQVVR